VWSFTSDGEVLPPLLFFRHRVEGDRTDGDWRLQRQTPPVTRLEEAIVQGFFELVERDSTAIWWYNRLRRPAIRLDNARRARVARAPPGV
jgi:ribosomal protein S12 methylthiotransferase accessory factor